MATAAPVRVVPKYAWGLVVAGGIVWLALGTSLLLPGNQIDFTGNASNSSIYPPQAYSDLTYAGNVSGVFISIIGLFVVAVGFKALRRGEKWAWFAIAAIPTLMVLNSLFDYLGAGPGFIYNGGNFPLYAILSYLYTAVPVLLGLALSATAIFRRGH